jgi:putative membrane protein
MRIALVAAIAAALQSKVMAHGLADELTTPGALSPWDIAAIAGLMVLGACYAAGTHRLARRGAVHRTRESIAFWLGWGVLLASIMPPLDGLALEIFSAHMAQHELMMLVGAPLLIAGRPVSTVLWGLPQSARPGAAALLQGPAPSALWRALTTPVVAWAVHGLVIWVWHAPALYEWAVHNESVHAVQHLMFVGTSMLFWWGLIYGRYGRAGYGAAVLYVFTTAVHTGILGALVTFAGRPLYPTYVGTAMARGTDPLADQQVAGLLMWVPAGIVLTLIGLALFMAWIGESDRRQSQRSAMRGDVRRIASRAGLLVVIAVGVAAGCGGKNDNERIARELTGGDPGRGRTAIHNYGCDTCHRIPGILTAVATVGPSLDQLGRRVYLAGRIENTPENLVQWIKHPRSVDERTAMPETGVNARDGRDIAAYLYTLR